MKDPFSEIPATDAEAMSRNQQIRIRKDTKDKSGNDDLIGGRTELDVSGVITVTIDVNENPVVSGYDSATGKPVKNYPESQQEVAEHEVAGEARALMRNPDISRKASGAAAVAAENRYRERRANPFRRVGHSGKQAPGRCEIGPIEGDE